MSPEKMERMNVEVAKDLASQRKEIETLRAENEALKAQNENSLAAAEGFFNENRTLYEKLESKDSQIKVLAEALETRHLATCRSFDRPYFRCDCGTIEALSTIPAEALEEWRLEWERLKREGFEDGVREILGNQDAEVYIESYFSKSKM